MVIKGAFLVEWSDVDQVYVARHSVFALLATHGDTPEAALREIVQLVVESQAIVDAGAPT